MKEIDKQSIEELKRAYQRYLDAPSGGGSDWDGGGNPHRMMEDDEERRAWAAFRELCEKKGLDTEEAKEIIHNSKIL